MNPRSVWVGVVLLSVGACGFLDAAGIVESSRTIADWWPLAVITWPLAEMPTTKHASLSGTICAGVGLALLADLQHWASGGVVWSGLAVFVGLAVLTAAGLARPEDRRRDAGTPAYGAGASARGASS